METFGFSFNCPHCHEVVDVTCELTSEQDGEDLVAVIGPPRFRHECSATGKTLINHRYVRFSEKPGTATP